MSDSAAKPAAAAPQAKATATPIPFTYRIVDDPNSKVNAVTGINQLGKIVGVFEGGSASNLPESYQAFPPYSKFRTINDPGAQGTYATGLSSNKMVTGYVIDPPSQDGIWGFLRVNSLWTLIADSNEGTGNNAVTELLGLNDSGYGVGFYTNNSGVNVPFELDITSETFTDLSPPGASNAEATGINGKSNISGWEMTSGGVRGFFLQSGTYYTVSYPKAHATYALGLNWQDQVVGSFIDSQGQAEGFILTGPTRGGGEQVWQRIVAPRASSTWVTGINNHDDICGYFINKAGVQHGFIATPKSS